jgi:3-oxoacyl-[acyl-carrier-protein] synthase III
MNWMVYLHLSNKVIKYIENFLFMTTTIIGTGATLPSMVVKNSHFLNHQFYDTKGIKNDRNPSEIIEKLESITGITERRYVPFDQDSIPLMTETAIKTLKNAKLNPNDLSGIIVAHNAGNMLVGESLFHTVPNLAAYLKNAIQCENHECFAYDILFGCPGWVQALIQAHQAVMCGEADNVMVVGLEVASRMLDPHDLDSMILADGCGACIISKSNKRASGIKSYATFSHSQEDLRIIYLDKSNNAAQSGSCYFHMNGREVYKYATQWVPKVIEKALTKANISIDEIDMFLFHQANAKMLEAFANNLTRLYRIEDPHFFDGKIPSTIQFLGNTSVATIPTMLDLIMKKELGNFRIKKGQKVVFASVGAGMHCNALVYQF